MKFPNDVHSRDLELRRVAYRVAAELHAVSCLCFPNQTTEDELTWGAQLRVVLESDDGELIHHSVRLIRRPEGNLDLWLIRHDREDDSDVDQHVIAFRANIEPRTKLVLAEVCSHLNTSPGELRLNATARLLGETVLRVPEPLD